LRCDRVFSTDLCCNVEKSVRADLRYQGRRIEGKEKEDEKGEWMAGHRARQVRADERVNACVRTCVRACLFITLLSIAVTSGSSMLGMATLLPLVWAEALCHSGDLFGLYATLHVA
jgi:hypothetical protein